MISNYKIIIINKNIFFKSMPYNYNMIFFIFFKSKIIILDNINYKYYKNIRLCLVPGKYKGKKKNAKENDFLMFNCPMKNIKENQI